MTPKDLQEQQFEADIERYLLTEGGYTKGSQATYDKEKTSQIDSLITLKQEKIQELKDYKKSIIYEYVTGKKIV